MLQHQHKPLPKPPSSNALLVKTTTPPLPTSPKPNFPKRELPKPTQNDHQHTHLLSETRKDWSFSNSLNNNESLSKSSPFIGRYSQQFTLPPVPSRNSRMLLTSSTNEMDLPSYTESSNDPIFTSNSTDSLELPSYDDSLHDDSISCDLPNYEDSKCDESCLPELPKRRPLLLGKPPYLPPRPIKALPEPPNLLRTQSDDIVIPSRLPEEEEEELELELEESTVKKLEELRRLSQFLPPAPVPILESDDDVTISDFDDDTLDDDIDDLDEDESIIRAIIAAEIADEEQGSDNLDECKMVVSWGSPGIPPPVPSRDDPSHRLSDRQALQFIKQKDEIPDAYQAVTDDPRLQRLKLKWCPNVLTKEGAIQFVKNKIEPQTIPYVGILFHMNHIREAKNGKQQVEKIKKTCGDELKSSMDTFIGAQITRGVQETAYTGVAAACMALPIVDFIPGLSAQLMILGEVGAGVAETGIEMGLKVVISKTSGQLTSTAMASTDAFGGYGSSKAFLLYLGYPKTDDPLYSQWEPHRLKLKALYGCAPEDNLFKMKPKGELLKNIEREEKKTGKPYQVEVPLLVLLWRAFDCWHDHYYDQIVGVKEKGKAKTKEVLGLRRDLTLEERRRMRDFRKLRETAAVIESKNAIDPHLVILKKTRKKEIVNVLTESLLHSYHVSYIFSRKTPRREQKSNLKWFIRMVVDYFMAHNAFFWGYLGTDNEIRAVAIWDRPYESGAISFVSMLKTSGAFKLGPNRWKKMSDILFKTEEIRKKDIRGLRCWMLHWIGVLPKYQKQGIGRVMIENTIKRHTEPVYIQLFDIEEDMILFLKKLCFVPVHHADSRFSLYGQAVSVVAYWHGIQSPSELRALLPAKKKNPLQLTYSTLRKATSYQSLPSRTAKRAIAARQTQLLLQSPESKLLQEAQHRFEETSTLLDHLKMDLASLPTENREKDPVAQSLQQKIKEYTHLVETYRVSLEDAKKNVNSLQLSVG